MAVMVYALIMAAFAGIMLYIINYGNRDASFNPSTIIQFYIVLSCLQLGLIFIIVPALTAGSISSEREKQTLNLLLVTKMSTFKIALGKLMSSLLHVLLMIVASMPVYAIVFYYGGISILDLLVMILYTMLIAATIGSVAIFLSSMLKKTTVSTVLTFIIVLAVTLGSFIIMLVISYFIESISWNSYIHNPVLLAISELQNQIVKSSNETRSLSLFTNMFFASTNPAMGFGALLESQYGTNDFTAFLYEISGLYSYGYTAQHIPLYLYNAGINIIVIIGMLYLTARNLIPVKKSRRYK